MVKVIDLKGKKFGKLTVIEYYKFKKYHWLCKCDCGNETIVNSQNLKNDHTKSCGCLKKELGCNNLIDIKHQVFGRLTVIEYVGNKNWLCKCNCGNKTIINGTRLRKNKVKSCGCLVAETASKYWYKGGPEVSGYDTFSSRLEPIEETRRNPNYHYQLQVKCSTCGKWINPTLCQTQKRISALNKTGGHRFYCSNECKQNCSVYRRRKYPKGFNDNKLPRPGQKEWSDLVKQNANYKCEICGSTEYLEAHHIESINYNPVESMDTDNGVCLCYMCHKNVHKLPGCSTYDLRKDQLCLKPIEAV